MKDINIAQLKNDEQYNSPEEKQAKETVGKKPDLNDNILLKKFPHMCGLLAEKVYQGVQASISAMFS